MTTLSTTTTSLPTTPPTPALAAVISVADDEDLERTAVQLLILVACWIFFDVSARLTRIVRKFRRYRNQKNYRITNSDTTANEMMDLQGAYAASRISTPVRIEGVLFYMPSYSNLVRTFFYSIQYS